MRLNKFQNVCRLKFGKNQYRAIFDKLRIFTHKYANLNYKIAHKFHTEFQIN